MLKGFIEVLVDCKVLIIHDYGILTGGVAPDIG